MGRSRQSILLVEDSPEDAEITLRAFRRAGLTNTIHRCHDGDDALDYLHQHGKYGNPGLAPRPGLILLDLNLPGTDGRDVLAEIKKDESLKSIPVIVLTTSTDARDVLGCYRLGANGYLKKPVDLEDFLASIRSLTEFWFEVGVLPGEA